MSRVVALVVSDFMLGEPNPLAHWEEVFDGAEVSGSAADFPPSDDVLRVCRSTRAATRSVLDSLTEEELDRSSVRAPEGAEGLFGTYRRCLQYAADHWLMHRGQLADARRAAGLDRMWY